MSEITKPKIMLTGSGPHIGQLAQMADHVSPDRLVWTGDSGTPPDSANVAGGRAVSSVEDIDPDVIIIGGETGEDGNFAFPPNKNTWFIPGSHHRVHHPCVFSDMIPLDFSGRFVACGYPGSGNGLLQAIIRVILSCDVNQRPFDEVASYIPAYEAHFSNQVSALLSLFGAKLGTSSHDIASYKESTVAVTWIHNKNVSTLFGLPTRNYIFERVHGTHEPFGKKILMMGDAGAKCVLAVRNPLNTIVSVANKSDELGFDLLGTDWLFRLVGRGLIHYYRSFIPAIQKGQVIPIRYEDLQISFEQVAGLLASKCGIGLTNSQINEMKSRLLNKKLPGHDSHMWQPDQTDKWRQYLGSRHFGILAEEGMSDIMDRLGYSTSFLEKKNFQPQKIMTKNATPTSAGEATFLLYCIENSQENLNELCRLGVVHRDFDKEMFLISDNPGALGIFESFVHETDFMRLINSGSVFNLTAPLRRSVFKP